MNTLQIGLRGTRTASDVYKDTALLNGYESELTSIEEVKEEGLTEAERNAYKYPSDMVAGSNKVEKFTREDGTVDFTVTYKKEVKTPNPETAEQFGKKLVQKEFAVRDSQLAGDAEKKRAELEYELLND